MLLAVLTLPACSKSVKPDTTVAKPEKVAPKVNPNIKLTAEEEKVAAAAFDREVVKLERDPKVWKQISDGEGIQTFEKIESNDQIVAFRGEAVIPADLAKIATVLNTPSLRKEWIDGLAETRLIEQVSDLEHIEYNHTNVPWPFQDRDFVYRATVQIKKSPPTMLIKMASVEDDRQPKRSGIVRGEIIYSYYYLKQVEGVRATKVIIEMALDPQGAIPKWLVTLSQKKWPYNTLLHLKKTAQREDIKVSKEIRDYFTKKEKPRKTK